MKNNIKYFLSLVTLLVVFICVGNMVMAEENEVIVNEEMEEIEIIEAEDIGMGTIPQEVEVITEDPVDEVVAEDEVVDVPVQVSKKQEVTYESPEADLVEEKAEEADEVDESEIPEGMVTGYKEDVFFEPNCFDCETCDSCYKCEVCEFVEELYCDEEINPEGENWVLGKMCVVCGHGSNEPMTEEAVDEYLSRLP